MTPYPTNEQMEGLTEVQRAFQVPFRPEECIEFARVLNLPENQAKLAVGEIIFKGFDPKIDPAYLATHNYHSGMFRLENQYWQEHGDPRYAYGHTVGQDALNGRMDNVEHAHRPAAEDDFAIEHRKDFFYSKAHIDNNPCTGANDNLGEYAGGEKQNGEIAGEKQVSFSSQKFIEEAKALHTIHEFASSSTLIVSPLKMQLCPRHLAPAPTSVQRSATVSQGSRTMVLIQTTTSKNGSCSSIPPSTVPAALTTPKPPVLSYYSINNAKKKKDNGKDFMRTKVKYFEDWLRRMKRAPLPPRPKEPTADDKSLVAFIVSKEKALKAVEHTGSADPAMYDDDGMLVIDCRKTSRPKKRTYNELLEDEEQEGAD